MIFLIFINICIFVTSVLLVFYNDLFNKKLNKIKKEKIIKDCLTNFATNLKIRDDLIKSDFKGKVKNKKLLEELFNGNANLWVSLSGNYYGGYKNTMKQIIDYDFHNIEDLLIRLQEFEKKQETLDKYQIKKDEEKGNE